MPSTGHNRRRLCPVFRLPAIHKARRSEDNAAKMSRKRSSWATTDSTSRITYVSLIACLELEPMALDGANVEEILAVLSLHHV